MKPPESQPPQEIILAPPQPISPPAPAGVPGTEAQAASPPAHSPQQAQQMLVTANDSQSPSLPGEQKKKKEFQSLVSRIATLLIVIGGISLILLVTSIFQRNNPSFKPGDIIVLLSMAAAITLGIVGVITSEQLANILTFGAGGNPSKDRGEKKEGGDKAS